MGLRVGVIGVGHLGRHHARIYAEMEGVELTGVVDADRVRAGDIARQYGSRAYTDFREALDGLQALSIATPTSTHYAIALECLRAGKDLLIEKPITLTVREADELIEEAQKRGLILQVGHIERYNPAVVALFRLAAGDSKIAGATCPIAEGHALFEAERVSPFKGRAGDVDVTLDLMIHDIDIILGLTRAKVTSLSAAGVSAVTDKIDYAKAWLEFENGSTAVITASRISEDTKRALRIWQKGSSIIADCLKPEVKIYTGLSTETVPLEMKEPLKEELLDFAACVIERRRPKVSGVEARDALELAIKITERIKERL